MRMPKVVLTRDATACCSISDNSCRPPISMAAPPPPPCREESGECEASNTAAAAAAAAAGGGWPLTWGLAPPAAARTAGAMPYSL